MATREWLEAGYRTEQVDLQRGTVVFRRLEQPLQVAEAMAPVWDVGRKDVKAKVSKDDPLFGAFKGMIHIPPDVDLTEPAEPDWEETFWKKWDEKLKDWIRPEKS